MQIRKIFINLSIILMALFGFQLFYGGFVSAADSIYTCGNFIQEFGEECDSGPTGQLFVCRADCTLSGFASPEGSCGDGTQNFGEECDKNDPVFGAFCRNDCTLKNNICGNGIKTGAETCDDGNTADGDGCSAICKVEECGDGIQQASEECDDNNTNNNDGCDAFCQKEEICGNGIIETGEQCDDNDMNNNDGCNEFCQLEIPTCTMEATPLIGNAPKNIALKATADKNWGAIIDIAYDNGKNSINNSGTDSPYNANATYEYGGTYKPYATVQNKVSPVKAGTIRPTANCDVEIKIDAKCGDGIINQLSEQCDDGNNDNKDGCTFECQLEIPKCSLTASNRSGASPLSTTFTAAKLNGNWMAFEKLDYDDGNFKNSPGASEAYTYNDSGNQAYAPRMIVRSTYAGPKKASIALPTGQCGEVLGTMRYQEIKRSTKTKIAFDGTCFGSQPVMIVKNIQNINNLSDPTLDRRYFNNFRISVAYAGCYSLSNSSIVSLLNTKEKVYSDDIPDDTTLTPPRVSATDFPDSDMLNEDRIQNPLENNLDMNIGFIHYRPDIITGEYTKLQEKINDIYPFEGDLGEVGFKLTDSFGQNYETNLVETMLYPYCYVYPKIVLKTAKGRNDKELLFKYLGCDPLVEFDIDFDTDKYKGDTNITLGTRTYNYLEQTDGAFNGKKNFSDLTMGGVCIENDVDGDGIMCNTDKDKLAVGAFEEFVIDINFPNEIMPNYNKNVFLTSYLDDITKDSGKDIFLSLYSEILGLDPHIQMDTTDLDKSNDMTISHPEIGYRKDFNIHFEPALNMNEFKVMFTKSNDKDFLQTNGLLKIGYDNVQVVDEIHGVNYKPYGIVHILDPYGNEIEIMKKRIEFIIDDSHNKNNLNGIVQYIPIIMDNTYPDGIYTIKMEIFDVFNNKIERDQYTSYFKSNSGPQLSVYLKEIQEAVGNKIKITETFNNGYLIDGKDYANDYKAVMRLFLHKPLEELNVIDYMGGQTLYLDVNNSPVYVPLGSIKNDPLTGLLYTDIKVGQTPISGIEGKLQGGTINKITIKDKYGLGNDSNYYFNVMLTNSANMTQPNLTEDYNNYLLKIDNVFHEVSKLPVINGLKDGVEGDGIVFFNNNLWFTVGPKIYVKDFSNNIVSIMDNNGYKKIKIKDDGVIQMKDGQLKANNNIISLMNVVVSDYDITKEVGFGIKNNGDLVKFDKNGLIEKVYTFEDPKDINSIAVYYIPTNNSYEIFTAVNGKLYILNYNLDSKVITYDYGPKDKGFTNSMLINDVLDIDIKQGHNKMNVFILSNTPDRAVRILQMPFIMFGNSNSTKNINLYMNATIPMDYYKKMVIPRVQLSRYVDLGDGDKEYTKMMIDVDGKKQNILKAYTIYGMIASNNATKTSDDFIGFDKYEIYNNGVKVSEKELTTLGEKKGDTAITTYVPFDGETNALVIKGVNNVYGNVDVIAPIIKYLYSFNLSGLKESEIDSKIYDDGKYKASVKFIDKGGKVVDSYDNQEILLINNKLYSYIPIYTNKVTSGGQFKLLNYLNGGFIEVVFNYQGETLRYKIPFETKLVSKFSIASNGLVNGDGTLVDFTKLVGKEKVDMLKQYVGGFPKQFVDSKNFVERTFMEDVNNWDFSNYDQLFICINNNDVDKLKFKLEEIYDVLIDDTWVINDNKMDKKEYLQDRFKEKIKWFKETKYQGDKCINISDLLN